MHSLSLHNTLTRQTETFTPIDSAGRMVTFYSCGPTVYDDAHVGNFRSFLNADVLRRTLELIGYSVRHVMNITDVGHMTDDTDADGGGEDKMAVAGRRIAEAKKSGKLPAGADIDPRDPLAIADFYANRFIDDARTLGLKVAQEFSTDPTLMPRPTQCIPQMIALVEKLIARNHAYVAGDGVVYFDIRSFPSYGKLSGNTLDALREGAGERISADNQSFKRHPADFMLWKPDAAHVMKWDSPWGAGYPGWHLECSAMAAAFLGEEIDLHSGGEDNIFPHHECEIAQSCCGYGHTSFSRVWFHTRHLVVEGEKMSKSKGNFFTVRDVLAREITPAALRLELIRTHYRTNANFTWQGLKDCQRQIDRWTRAHSALIKQAATKPAESSAIPGPFQRALEQFTSAMCDDLNVARASAAINTAVSESPEGAAANTCAHAELSALNRMNGVLAVFERNVSSANISHSDPAAEEFKTKVESLIAARAAARAAKDWAAGDRVRDELVAIGVQIKDSAQGTTWTRM